MVRRKEAPIRRLATKPPTKGSPSTTEPRPRRWRPGTVALREIKKYQKKPGFLVARQRFNRVVRDILSKYRKNEGTEWRISKEALRALQHEGEGILTESFEAAQKISCIFKKRTCVKEAYIAVTSGDFVINGIPIHSAPAQGSDPLPIDTDAPSGDEKDADDQESNK